MPLQNTTKHGRWVAQRAPAEISLPGESLTTCGVLRLRRGGGVRCWGTAAQIELGCDKGKAKPPQQP